MAHRKGGGADDLRKERLGHRVAVQYAALSAFLVIEHDLQRDSGAVRPARMRRLTAVAAQVARVGTGIADHCLAPNTVFRSIPPPSRSPSMSSAKTWSRC